MEYKTTKMRRKKGKHGTGCFENMGKNKWRYVIMKNGKRQKTTDFDFIS